MARGQLGKATLQNISTSGCYVRKCTTQLAKNDQVLIVIELADAERPLELKAIVVRADEKDFSAEFTHIEKSFLTEFSTMLAAELRTANTLSTPDTTILDS